MSGTVALVALLALGQSEGSASQPAGAGLAPGSAADVQAELTVIIELNDDVVRAQESWNIRNPASRRIPKSALRLELPAAAKGPTLDETVDLFSVSQDGTRFEAKTELVQQGTVVSGAYRLDKRSGTIDLSRSLPFQMGGVRIIAEDFPGISLTASFPSERRERELNGVKFAIWDLPPMPAGTRLSATLKGIPDHASWPKAATLLACAVVVLVMLLALRSGRVPGQAAQSSLGPLAAASRRERLVRAIEILEEDRKAERITEKRYLRRREVLLAELAEVLREQDLEKRSALESKA